MTRFDRVIGDPAHRDAPPADVIRAELGRLLANPDFRASERRRAFLRFIVEETLAGRAERLKGFTIAVTVFGRDQDFDPQADPVVRLEARRLRRDLDSYYVDAGSEDPVRFSIPKGTYMPRFEWRDAVRPKAAAAIGPSPATDGAAPAGPAPTRFPRRVLQLAAALLLAVAAVGAWAVLDRNRTPVSASYVNEPSVVVLPFEPLSSSEEDRYLAEGMSQELVVNLMRFPGFRLYILRNGMNPAARVEPAEVGRDLGVAYAVSGSLRAGAGRIRVTAQVVDAPTGRVLWTDTYDRPATPQALFQVQSDLAGEISGAVGQPYGVLNNDLRVRLATPAVSSMQSYVCVLRAFSYRRDFARDQFQPVMGCLEEAVTRDPGYADAWAMLGWLHLDAGRFEFSGSADPWPQYELAVRAASKAVSLEPENTLALKALSSVRHYMGDYDESAAIARRAFELNPHDPDTMAQYGWRLAIRGNFAEGIPLLERAVVRSANPPGWYFYLMAIDLCLKGNYAEMLEVARRSAPDRIGVSFLLLAIASAEAGDRDGTRTALERMQAFPPLARDPAAHLRRHGATEEIIDALTAGLRKAERFAAG